MPPRLENATALWFRRLVWAGIIGNFILGTIGIASPGTIIDLLDLEPPSPLVWPRFAAFLLILLSLFYVAGARDPVGTAYAAWMTVLARFGGFGFFLVVGGNYILFGLYDLLFGLPQAILLHRLRSMRHRA
jgi:hypothetical protein